MSAITSKIIITAKNPNFLESIRFSKDFLKNGLENQLTINLPLNSAKIEIQDHSVLVISWYDVEFCIDVNPDFIMKLKSVLRKE